MKQLPRLVQPLFSPAASDQYFDAREDFLMFRACVAYDALWSLIYKPKDIAIEDRLANAKAAMQNLGWQIEQTLGQGVFMPALEEDGDAKDQLSFVTKEP